MTIRAPRIILLLCGLVTAGSLITTADAQQRRRGYSYQTGQELYEHVCQSCHMPDAKGAAGAGAYPALANNRRLQTPLYPVLVILRGQKAMPAFSELTDDQVSAVTNYIRTNYGNGFPDAVTPEQVKGLRSRQRQQDAQRPG